MFSCVTKTFITYPNGHTLSNQHQFDSNIISISQRENIDKCPYHFDVVFHCNFIGQKIGVDVTYFPRRNVQGQEKSMSFLRTLFNVISMGKQLMSFQRTLLDVISMSEKSTSFRHLFDLILIERKRTLLQCIF